MLHRLARCGLGVIASVAIACDSDTEAPPQPLIPQGVETAWTQTRQCRSSHEHWLHSVRVVVSDNAVKPYNSWQVGNPQPFPVGALVVKPEYDDQFCDNLIGYTVMRKEAPGYWPEANDWHWQKLDAQRRVIEDGKLAKSCAGCHAWHCAPPNGFDFTCTPD